MTHDEQLDASCHCGLSHMETMDELLAALTKVEALRPFLPHDELEWFDALALYARSMENLCERRAYVRRVLTLTTIILCEGHYRNYDRDWPGDCVLMSVEDWAFDRVSPEELDALCALPGAAGLSHLLLAGNTPAASVGEAVAEAHTS